MIDKILSFLLLVIVMSGFVMLWLTLDYFTGGF